MREIITAGPLKFSEPNCPTRVGEIINSISEIHDIPNPRVGMLVYVEDEDRNYTITGLKEKTIEGVVVPNAQVDTYRCVENILIERIQDNSNAITAEITRAKDEEEKINMRLDKSLGEIVVGLTDGGLYIDMYNDKGELLREPFFIPTADRNQTGLMSRGDKTYLDSLNNNGELELTFTRSNQSFLLNDYDFDIPKGVHIKIESNTITELIGRYNTADGMVEQKLVNGTITEGIITRISNKEEIGDVTIKYTGQIKELRSAIDAEETRAKDAETANRKLITDLIGESPETLDTIHEISSWILNDETGAAAMVKEINENKNAISDNVDILIEHDKIVRPVIVYLNGKQGLLSLGLVEVGTSKEINFIISAKKGVETITNMIITVNGNRIDSDTYTENVTTTKEYNVKVVYTYNINNKEVTEEAQSKAYVTFVKAMYFGFNEFESINNDIINSFEKQQLNTTPIGTYEIISPINGYMWLCVPDNMNINKVTIGGFDVPIELNNTSEVDGYKCYRSSNKLVAGTYNILIS